MKRNLPASSSYPVVVLALLLTANLCWSAAAADAWEALPKYQFGQSREPLATIEEQIRKGGMGEREKVESRLLEVLQAPATTKDSCRFICQWLGTVGSEKSVAPLAALLTDPDLAHPARIALERLPYASADMALTDALGKAQGNQLIGVLSSIGAKQVAAAVPEIANLLKHQDPSVVRAALSALGQIGTETANRTLASAKVSPAMERDLANARVSAASRLAESGKRAEAVAVFRELLKESSQPAVRGAAFQGLALALPAENAVTLIVNALESDDVLLRSAAVKAFSSLGQAGDAVAGRLPSMQPMGQLLLLGILADAPQVAARKPLLQLAEAAPNPAVKAAAVECLAVHGQAEDVPLVAKWAVGGEAPVQAAARKTLQRMSGPGVDAALIRLIESADSGSRKAVLEALPSRRTEAALPTLTRLVRGNEPSVATEAAKTIGQMGEAGQIKDLAQVVATTKNEEVRSAAQEAIKDICVRAEDKAACDAVIQGELAQASTAEARTGLLPLTIYTGSEAGMAQVLEGMGDANAQVRRVAFRTLVSWPEPRAAAQLLRFAETNSDASQAIVALRDGCLRFAEMEEVPVAERAAILRGVIQVAKRPEERRRAVSLMGQVPSLELLDFLSRLTADESLRPEAIRSAVQLARSLGAVYPRQSLAALEQLRGVATTPELREKLEDGIKAVRNAGQSPQGHILGWLVSGPYTAADKDGSALFDVVFPPEQTGAKAEWRPINVPVSGMVDLGKVMPGDNRVAYLRTTVSSEEDQAALLELGSDDGVKVWLNGQVLLANNAVRPCTPAQDKVKVPLKKGDNVLLLKVTQGSGDWAAVARLVAPDGKPLSNAMIGPPKE